MFSKKGLVVIAFAAGLLTAACASFHSAETDTAADRSVASTSTWTNNRTNEFNSSVLANLSSSGNMPLSNARVIVDNNRAFQSKLSIVHNAQHELRMVYFIYSDDYSSSLFNTEVIAAAKRGVKVRLLVDFFTNYERLDLFQYLENQGHGNIKVHFYGLPTEAVLRGAIYQTLPCSKAAVTSPEQCQAEKVALIAAMGNPQTTWFSKIYLTALYGKNAVLMQTAVGLGAQFDSKSLTKTETTPEEKAGLKKFAKLVFEAKMKHDALAKLKVGIALQTNSAALNPIMNELTGRLPLEKSTSPDWDHITDYTHHKLIVADGARFQLGGRNVEDSYHTDAIKSQIPEAEGKYTFMDTDFYGETPGATRVEAAFDRLFNFSPMVGDLQKVQNLVPNEYDVNIDQFKMSLGSCLQDGQGTTPATIETCVNKKITGMKDYKTVAARDAVVQDNMAAKRATFASTYKAGSEKTWKADGDTLAGSDITGAEAYYMENLSFTGNNPGKRLFGSKIGLEAENGKYLHAAWLKGLENVCATSTKSRQPKRVILHSAYLFLSSGLVNALGNMMNGKWKCPNVDVVLITNSFETTDLNVINIFARYQLQALLKYNQDIEGNPGYVTANQYKAHIRYFEYKPSTSGNGISLHTKVSLLGDDMIIGSANADIRSYFMDTNNGVYLRKAPQLVSNYAAFVDGLISSGQLEDKTHHYAVATTAQFQAENRMILDNMLQKFDPEKKVSAKRQGEILVYVDKMGNSIRSSTEDIINGPAAMRGQQEGYNTNQNNKIQELEKNANGFDSVWKVL